MPTDVVGPSCGAHCVSFSAPDEDWMSIPASKSGLLSLGEDEAELPPSGVVAHAKSDSELMAMLAWAVAGIRLEWNPSPSARGWMIDSWVRRTVHSLVPPQCLSSRRFMSRFKSRGRHLLMPEAALLPTLLSL